MTGSSQRRARRTGEGASRRRARRTSAEAPQRPARRRAWRSIASIAFAILSACKGSPKTEPAPVDNATGSNATGSNATGSNGSNVTGSNGSNMANGSNATGSNTGSNAGSNVPDPWAALAELPRVTPARIITIPTRPSLPRFTVGGPVIRRELAVVSSSQFGFAAVDWRRGALVWTKPAGIKVAPPVVNGDTFVLIGDCVSPPEVPEGEMLLGCLRVVTAEGLDQAYIAIHGASSAIEAFAGAPGEQQVWIENYPDTAAARSGNGASKAVAAGGTSGVAAGDKPGSASAPSGAVDGEFLRWRRGDQIVRVNLLSGTATPVRGGSEAKSLTPVREAPPVVVEYSKRRWEIEHIDGKVVAFERGKRAWAAQTEVNALLGAVWLPGQGPMVRMVKIGGGGGTSEVRILDMDATGSMNGTASWTPVPGISLLGRAISPVGDAALAVRLDATIKHDFIAAYAASALLIYVFPLPDVLRADPVGLAIALDDDGHAEAVVAFYDGDQLAVLPNVLAPPTAPGATAGTLEKPTP